MTERLLYLSLIYYLIAPRIEGFQPSIGLRATLVNATLPIAMGFWSTQAVFDGNDYIYLFGGYNNHELDRCKIFYYSISLDVVKCVDNLTDSSGVNYGFYHSTSNLGKNGKFYISTSQTGPFDLYEFDPSTNHVRGIEVPIATTSTSNAYNLGFLYSAVTNSGSLILILFGESQNNNTVYEWHVNATTYRTITLPFRLASGSVHYLPESNKLLVVNVYDSMVALLDVETGQTEILHSLLWTIKQGFSAVVNGVLFRFGYVDEIILQKFLWYDLAEQHQGMIDIENFPHNNSSISLQAGVYVPTLNRMYIFGGYAYAKQKELLFKDIWYVDMNPVPDIPDIPIICDGMKGMFHVLVHYCFLFYYKIKILKVGEPCVDIGCSRCGFCWGNTSFYLQCNSSTSQIIRDKCDPGLWWNPLEKPQQLDIGGTCDQWKNLPLEIRQQYEKDSNCVTPHCLWGQYEQDRCSGKYWHSNENGDRENLECGGDLVWDNVKQQCRLCKNVSGCNIKNLKTCQGS